MPVIKRYPNRKLYNTEENKYVNLDTIAKLILDGQEVQVIDHVTGEDLTAVTLTQIIMEREKNDGEFLPRTLLTELIKVGGESLNTIKEKIGSPSDLIQQVNQEIEARLEKLIQRGEIAEETGKKLKDKLVEESVLRSSASLISEKDIEAALVRHGIPTRSDFQQLIDQIEQLSSKLEES